MGQDGLVQDKISWDNDASPGIFQRILVYTVREENAF